MCIITQVGPDMRAVGRVDGNMARYIYMEIIYMYVYVCVCVCVYIYIHYWGGSSYEGCWKHGRV